MRDFLRHGAIVFGGIVAANAFVYVYYALVQRAVGVEGAGLFMALVAATFLLSSPGNVIGAVVAKLAADAAALQDGAALRTLGVAMTALVAPVGVVSILAATAGAPALQRYFHVGDPLVIALAAAGLAFTFPLVPQRAVLQGAGRFSAFATSNLIEGVVKAAAGVVVFVRHGDVRMGLAGFVVAAAIVFAFNAGQIVRGPHPVVSLRLGRAAVLRHLRGIALPVGAITAMSFADGILVRHYLSATAAGLYAFAALVGRAILTLTQFAPAILMPKVAAAVAAGRSPVRLLFTAAVTTCAVAAAPLTLAAAAPHFVTAVLAGARFDGAAPLLLPYAVAMVALALATTLVSYLVGLDRHGFAVPVGLAALGEIVGIGLFHPDAAAVLRVVVIGHSAAFACCLADTLASLAQRRSGPAASPS